MTIPRSRSQPTGRRAGPPAGLVALVCLAAACGPPPSPGGVEVAPPEPDRPRGRVPDLTGAAVHVYPVQRRGSVPGEIDAEIRFAFEALDSDARWIGPDQLRENIARTPGITLAVDGFPVDPFLAGEVLRVGDPIYGFIRRMAVIDQAAYALIPVAAAFRDADGVRPPGIEIAAALLDTQSGRVLWHGVVEGEGALDDPGTLARAAQNLARWFG